MAWKLQGKIMATYLIHKLHGTHVAYTQNEIDTCLEEWLGN